MRAYRGTVLHCVDDPGEQSDPSAWECFEDGLLIVDGGRIARVGDAEPLLAEAGSDVDVVDYRGKQIVPGFIDCHLHFSQLDIIGSFGEQLLDWLNRYAFPE